VCMLCVIFSIQAFALVDMKNANYSNEWVDMSSANDTPTSNRSGDPPSIVDLGISRGYNSRSLFDGIFGFGWCSDIETTVKMTPEGNVKLRHCGGGQEVEYVRRDFSISNIGAKVRVILELMRARLKNSPGVGAFLDGFDIEAWNSIEARMLEDEGLRSYWAQVLGVEEKPVEGETYTATLGEEGSISFKAGHFIKVDSAGNRFTFDRNGRLVGQSRSDGVSVSIIRDEKGGVKKIERSDGSYLNFALFSNGKVKSITRNDGVMSEYRYSDGVDLALVKNSWLKIYKFSYDDLHNLTKVEWPDKTYIEMVHDKSQDWVTGFRDRDGCMEDYLYESALKDGKNNYSAHTEKWCKDVGLTQKALYKFSHAKKTNGEYFLQDVIAEVSTYKDYVYRHVKYDSVLELPVAITINKAKVTYVHSDSGRVLQRQLGNKRWVFSYTSNSGLPDTIRELVLDKNNKIISSKLIKKDPWSSMYFPPYTHLPPRLKKTKLSPLLVKYLVFRSKNDAISAARTLKDWDASLLKKGDNAGRTLIMSLAITSGFDQLHADHLEAAEISLRLASDIASANHLKSPQYRALHRLADVKFRQLKYNDSATIAQESIAIGIEVEGQDSPSLIPIYMLLAKAREKQERYAELVIALKKSEKSEVDSGEAVEQVRARMYKSVGLFEQAKGVYRQSSSTLEKAVLQSSMSIDDVFTLGDILAFGGNPNRAAEWISYSVTIGDFESDVLRQLKLRQASYLTQARHYSDAMKSIDRAMVMEGNVKNPLSMINAMALKEKAVLYSLLGKQGEAITLLNKSLEIAKQSSASELQIEDLTQSLGILYRDAGDYENALRLFNDVKNSRLLAYPPEHWLIGDALYQIGETQRMAGNLELASKALRESQTIIESALGYGHAMSARGLLSQGRLILSGTDKAHAVGILQSALEMAIRSNDQEYIWQSQWQISVALGEIGKSASAIFFAKQAIETIQQLRFKLVGMDSSLQNSFLKNKQDVYRGTASLLIDEGRLAEAQNVMKMLKEEELSSFVYSAVRSGPEATILLTPQEESWSSNYDRIRNNLSSMGVEQDLLKKKLKIGLSAIEQQRLQELDETLSGARREFDYFVQEIQAEATNSNAERAKTIGEFGLTSLRSTQGTLRALGHGAVIVTYIMSTDKVSILVTTPTVQIARVVAVDEHKLNRLVAEFRSELQDPNSNPVPIAKSLYDILIRPISQDLQQFDARVLMVSLDGVLRYIPLGALHDGGQYVINKYAIVNYAQAARDKLKDIPMQVWTIAGLGITAEAPGFPALPGVKAELEGIIKSGGAGVLVGNIYLDAAFTKQQVQNSLNLETPVIHIASHFVFAPGNESASFLLLGDGTRLSLDELRYSFDFSHVELLTLSACETAVGGGKNSLGQEIEGFGALAQIEGAKAVIATLWSVSDDSTAQFMKKFYELKESDADITKAEAIRLSQLSLLDMHLASPFDQQVGERGGVLQERTSGMKEYNHPYYWAPFILMGNWL